MKKKQWEPETVVCPGCGKRLTPVVPKGGDGTADVFRRHKDKAGNRCRSSRMQTPKRKED